MNRTLERHAARWQAFPLCCKYLVAQFESRDLRAGRPGGQRRFAQWVLGTLQTGESEVVGLWMRDAVDWPAAMEDLQVRGVESIRFVVSTHPTDLAIESLRATAAPSIDQLLRELPTGCSGGGRLRRTLIAADVEGRRFRAALRLS